MLKANVKVWAIVVALCLVGQFFLAAVPGWIEQGKQEAQVEIAKREEERLKESHEPGLEPIEKNPVNTAPIETAVEDSGSIEIEKTNESTEIEEEEKISSGTILLIFIAVVMIVFLVSVLFF